MATWRLSEPTILELPVTCVEDGRTGMVNLYVNRDGTTRLGLIVIDEAIDPSGELTSVTLDEQPTLLPYDPSAPLPVVDRPDDEDGIPF